MASVCASHTDACAVSAACSSGAVRRLLLAQPCKLAGTIIPDGSLLLSARSLAGYLVNLCRHNRRVADDDPVHVVLALLTSLVEPAEDSRPCVTVTASIPTVSNRCSCPER